MKIADLRLLTLTLGVSLAGTIACADDTAGDVGNDETSIGTGIGDGDGDPTGAEGQDAGDGDGDTTTGNPTGDGDGDPTAGDGDGDPTAGDGDGDPTTGDGDGDPSTGDGDGDPSTGDGDGDPTTGGNTTGNNSGCQAPAAYVDCDGTPGSLTQNPFQALGINCGNDPTSTVVAANAVMNSNDPNAWRIMAQFGTADQAAGMNRYNGKLWAANLEPWVNPDMEEIPNNTSTAVLMLSTGIVGTPTAQGVVTQGAQAGVGTNGNDDSNSLPSPLSALRGSNNGGGGTPFMNCDLVNDCSDSLYEQWYNEGWNDPNDKLWMQMDLTVPPGTEGYVFDFAYFSSEWPTWVDTSYNDMFVAWSTSETYTGNIAFVGDSPLTVTSLHGSFQYTGQAPQLAGTGYSGNAATGWYTARGSVAPQESFQLTFFIADMGDTIWSSAVLLDNFRWECAGCIPNEVNSCGIAPQ